MFITQNIVINRVWSIPIFDIWYCTAKSHRFYDILDIHRHTEEQHYDFYELYNIHIWSIWRKAESIHIPVPPCPTSRRCSFKTSISSGGDSVGGGGACGTAEVDESRTMHFAWDTYICVYIYVCVCVCMYVCMVLNVYLYMYMYMHMYMYMSVFIYIYISKYGTWFRRCQEL